MSNSKQAFKLSALASALLWAYGVAQAQSDEVRQLSNPDSWVSLGAGHWSGDRQQQGIYDGMRDNGGYGLLDLNLVRRDNATGTWYTLSGRNLGLDTRELKAEWLRQGDMGAKLEYSRTPRDNPWTFTTGLQGIGTETMVQSGAGANALASRKIELGTHRDLVSLDLYKSFMPGLDFKLSFKNEDKDGTRHWGRGSEPTFAVEPINSTTRQIEAIVEYTGEKLQLSGGYYGTWYDTANTLSWVSANGVTQPGTASSCTLISMTAGYP